MFILEFDKRETLYCMAKITSMYVENSKCEKSILPKNVLKNHMNNMSSCTGRHNSGAATDCRKDKRTVSKSCSR